MALRNERAKLDEASNDITEIIDAFARKNLPFSVQDIKDEFENKPVGSISRIYLMNLFDEVHQNKIKIGRAKITAESIYPFDETNPDNYYNIQTSPKTKKALTPKEFEKLKKVRKEITLAQQEAWDYFMLSYMFNGANLRDIADLKFSNIDQHDNTITFTRKKSSRRKSQVKAELQS